MRGAVGDIFTVDLETQEVVNLTNDPFGDRAPRYSPDGKFIIYTARVSGNDKLFRLELDTKKKTQITFGTQDETGAQFIDDHTIVFASTAAEFVASTSTQVRSCACAAGDAAAANNRAAREYHRTDF